MGVGNQGNNYLDWSDQGRFCSRRSKSDSLLRMNAFGAQVGGKGTVGSGNQKSKDPFRAILNLKPGIKILPSFKSHIYWRVGGDSLLERDDVKRYESFHFSYHLVSLPIKKIVPNLGK